MEQVIILGTGIAGCTAAIYAARAELAPVVISGPQDGGQLTLTTTIENFPGFPKGIGGMELVDQAKKQAERFGAKFVTDTAKGFKKIKEGLELNFSSGKKIQTKTLIIATGASARWLGLPSEKKYKGRGVSTCATCDGPFYKDKEVIVVGGGDSAMEESIFLSKFATKITVVHRRDELRASEIMQERAKKNKKISFIWDTEIKEFVGNQFLTGVKLKNNKTGKVTDFKCDGVFLAIGYIPNSKIFQGALKIDQKGYVETDRFTHTDIPGVFAAGDIQDHRFRQAITAAGSGCKAAIEAEKFLHGSEEE